MLEAGDLARSIRSEVELSKPLLAISIARGDLVQVLLQRGSEVVVDQIRQVLFQQAGDREGQPGGD